MYTQFTLNTWYMYMYKSFVIRGQIYLICPTKPSLSVQLYAYTSIYQYLQMPSCSCICKYLLTHNARLLENVHSQLRGKLTNMCIDV